jgi:hypothetical protein
MRDKHCEPGNNLRRILRSVSLALGTFSMRGRADLAPDVPAGDYYPHWPRHCENHLDLHDLVKIQYCIFNGYGHIHQEYRKVDGEWKITRSHASRLFVDEQWLWARPTGLSLWAFHSTVLSQKLKI